ncbi:hypothetical protein PR048_018261 [Dryococelus australis]|uniref:Uncharacterized protein n=1 Tax=Dryococelus australis TaxID=614101 RepID=A0ABQ9HBS7_9NEOP|nr:hypothetical protein PR048_018261 [Dryococelus australis]
MKELIDSLVLKTPHTSHVTFWEIHENYKGILKKKGRNTEFMYGWITEFGRKLNDHNLHSRYTYVIPLPHFTRSRVSRWHISLLGWIRREEKVEEVQESAVWMLDAGIVECDAGDGWVWVVSHLAVEFLGMASDQVGWRLYVAQAIQKFDRYVSWPAKDDA